MDDFCDLDYKNCLTPIYILVFLGIFLILIYMLVILYLKDNDYVSIISTYMSNLSAETWQITHFIAYALLGFFFPNCGIPVILIGVIWELLEYGMGHLLPPICVKQTNCNISNCNISNGNVNTLNSNNPQLKCTTYWFGNYMDIFINITGFLVGKAFRDILWDQT